MEIFIPAVSSRDPEQRYRVVLSDAGDECDCPDFYWRHINRGDSAHRCKHIRTARQLLVEGIPPPPARRAAGQAAPVRPGRLSSARPAAGRAPWPGVAAAAP